MKKPTIIILLIFVVLVVAGVFLYYYYEKPVADNTISYSNVSVFAKNKDGRNIKTDFVVFLNGAFYKQGTTSSKGAVLVKIPINSSIEIYNNNTKEQNFYIDKQNIFLNESTKRINLLAIIPGELEFVNCTEKEANVVSKGFIKELKFCLKYSGQIVYVRSNSTEIPKLQGFDNYDKCYDLGLSLEDGQSLQIPLDYKLFGESSQNSIKISFIDYGLNNFTYDLI